MSTDVLLADVVQQRDLDEVEARALVNGIRGAVTDIDARIATAYVGRAWIALGYIDWDALCEFEFDGARLRVPREIRVEQVQSLRSAGLSTRAIGSALGVSDGTVRTDLASGAQNYAPTPVVGQDGKTYAPVRPQPSPPPAPEGVTGQPTDAAPHTGGGEPHVPDLTGVELTAEQYQAKVTALKQTAPVEQWQEQQGEPLDLEADAWAEAARRHTEDGTVAQINREKPYVLAVLALHGAATAINHQLDPVDVGTHVPEVSVHRLSDIKTAHTYLTAFLDAAGQMERAS